MKRTLLTVAAILAMSSLASASAILSPVAWGDVSSYMFANAFNEQPTWSGTAVTGGVNSYLEFWSNWENGNKVSFIDLGEDWATWRIEQTWTQYMHWRGGAAHPYAELWWDDDKDVANDGTAETLLSFATQVHTGLQFEWIRDVDTTSSPVIPQGRYLMLKQPAGNIASNDVVELAFVGYKVPEPATLSLLCLGVLGVVRRRR